MHRGRRKAENPEAARRILAVAERIFAERGLAGARTEAIARSAGVNKAMLYYYFESKEKLFRAVFENLFQQAGRSIAGAMPESATAREAIRAFIEGYFQFRIGHPNYARLMQRMMIEDPSQIQWVVRNYFGPGFRRLTAAIEKGIRDGDLQPIDAPHTVINILAMIVLYFSGTRVHSILLRRNALSPASIARHKRAILDLLEHGLFRLPARPR